MKSSNYIQLLFSLFMNTCLLFGQELHNTNSFPSLEKQIKPINKFGVKIYDDYVNLNKLEDPQVLDWFKAQDSLAEAYFSENRLFNNFLVKFEEYQNREKTAIRLIQINEKGNYFFIKYDEEDRREKLYFQEDVNSKALEIFDPKSHGEITYLKPSFDGLKIAIGFPSDKKFSSIIRFLNIKTGEFYQDQITNINPSFGGIEWLPDSSGFIYLYFPVIDQSSSGYKKNSYSVIHKLGEDSDLRKEVFGRNNIVNIPIDFYPKVKINSSADEYIIGYSASSNDYYDAYIAKVSDLLSGKITWEPFFKIKHKVFTTEGVVRDNEFIFRQGNNVGNQISSVKLISPNFNKPDLLAEGTIENPINQLALNKDNVYFSKSKFGVEVSLWKINDKGGICQLQPPFVPGYATFFGGTIASNLIGVELDGWTSNYTRFLISEDDNLFKEGLQVETFYPEFKNLISEQIMIKSHDGVEVPLSLVYDPQTLKGSLNEVFIYVYGAYGESLSPFFYPIFLNWAARGGILAFPHVRGGGEKGKKWHEQGQKLFKFNSWKDLIACTEGLIQKGFTQKGLISLYTSSAGGITAGMAVNERPDLFSSFIAEVPRLNPHGLESSQTVSSTSYLEYGSVKDSLEYIGLVKMDPYYNLKSNGEYPATLIISASQDDRIPLWDSGKYIAKLQNITKGKVPVLLDIDYQNSHDKLGYDDIVKLYSKIFSFARNNMSRKKS